MSLTYTALKNRITEYAIGQTDSSAEFTAALEGFIDQAEQRLSRDLVVPALTLNTDVATSNSVSVFSYPSNAVYLRSLRVKNGALLTKRTLEVLQSLAIGQPVGVPRVYAEYSTGQFIVAPPSNGATDLTASFARRIPALSVDNSTNWYSENVPDLLLCACMVNAESFNQNEPRQAAWEQTYKDRLASALREADGYEIDRHTGGNP
jgi:hypothetical protein